MQHYDVIIIGAGIAGCGLAYNLNRIGYKGKILVIDKEEVGANAGFIYRNTFKKIIDKYNLTHEHIFDGVVLGSYKNPITIKTKMYFISYPKTCNHLLKHSRAEYKNETAINTKSHTLKTSHNNYSFKYLVDCSGTNFFLRKLLKLPLPFKYWIGKVRKIEGESPVKDNFFYYLYAGKNYMEDFYRINNNISQGDWTWSNNQNFNKIKSYKKNFFHTKIINEKIINEKNISIPASPVLPLVYKNYAFLGDSFGNASSSACEGIRPILESSELLANAIKQNNLRSFQKKWKKGNINKNIKQLSTKVSNKERLDIIEIFRNDTEILKDLMTSKKNQIPKNFYKQIPTKTKIKILYNLLYLKIKYSIMEIRYG